MAMSGSEDSNHAYKQIMPNSFVFNEYDEEKIKDFIKNKNWLQIIYQILGLF